jgi:hypothetical protein
MAVFKFGSQDPIPTGYQPIRDLLTGMGYKPENIGYNPQTKNPILMGNELDASKFIAGSDSHYYSDQNTLTSMLTSLGLMPTPQITYQDPYGKQLQDVVSQIQNRPAFQYDSSTDPGFQQASKDIQSKRNMLYSPATGEAVSQGIANALPQYEQAAYSRYQSEGDQLYNMFNVVMNLADRDYSMYKDAIDNSYREWEKNYTIQQDQIANQYKRIEYAYKKLDEIEMADNEVAAILGIPVGTKSQAAKQRAEDYLQKLEIMKKENEYNAQQQARSLANDKALIDYRDKSDLKKQEAEKGTADQQNYYAQFLNLYTTDRQWKDDPQKALQNVLARQTQHESLLGTSLYNKLVNTLQSLSSVTTKVDKSSAGKTLSMSEINSTAENMEVNGSSVQDIGTFIVQSLVDAGYRDDQIMGQLKSRGITYNEDTGEFSKIAG